MFRVEFIVEGNHEDFDEKSTLNEALSVVANMITDVADDLRNHAYISDEIEIVVSEVTEIVTFTL